MKRITAILFIVFLLSGLIWFQADSIQHLVINEAFGRSEAFYLGNVSDNGIILYKEQWHTLDLHFKSIAWKSEHIYDGIGLIAPENNSTVTSTSPLLQWFTTETNVVFNVWLGLSDDTLKLIAEQIAVQQIKSEDLFDLSSYSWRVDMITVDTIITGETWTFHVQKEIPLL